MKLHDLILHNFRLKLFALLTAVLVWVTVHLVTSGNLGPLFSSASQTNQVPR
jgi:hypothetical protein